MSKKYKKLENRIQELENRLSSLAGTTVNNLVKDKIETKPNLNSNNLSEDNLTEYCNESKGYHHSSRLVTFDIDDNMVTFMVMRKNLIGAMEKSFGTKDLSHNNLKYINRGEYCYLGLNYMGNVSWFYGNRTSMKFKCKQDAQSFIDSHTQKELKILISVGMDSGEG